MKNPPAAPRLIGLPPPKPLMVYDGDCGFCRKWINRWRFLTGDKLDYEPYQKVGARFHEIPRERFEKAVQLISVDGRVWEGAEAVFQGLGLVPGFGWFSWAYGRLPGFAWVSEKIYAFVATHRHFFSSTDSCGVAAADDRPTYFLSRWLFLRLLAIAYFTAFGSLWFQVKGLIGREGIEPVHRFLIAAGSQLGASAYLDYPTLCWANDSDGFLRFLCAIGMVLSLLLFFNLIPFISLVLLWVSYLSLVSVGGDFLSFQWDSLLLEAGFLACFLTPFRWRSSKSDNSSPSRIILFLFQWLLFRLMFCSGAVKLSSGDPTWRNLTALDYHYWTQPLPPLTAWYMAQLPQGFQKLSCLCMFGVELAVPFFLFGPRKLRPAVFLLLASLQLLIASTGNYCFFNLLALGLCLFALEDEAWPKWARKWFASGRPKERIPEPPSFRWPLWVTGLLGAGVMFLSLPQIPYSLGVRVPWVSAWMGAGYQAVESFRLVNSYGLFAVMTTTRPEIIVEGSRDGTHWKSYEFKWKAGDLKRAPAFVAPYHPRLDWQMWFAALSRPQENPWFVWFLIRLLQGSPEVLGLLKDNPFPDGPPKFIRAGLWQYHFTDFQEKAQTGNWWKAKYVGPYIPAFSLDQVRGSGWWN